jgi:hypothetical protein
MKQFKRAGDEKPAPIPDKVWDLVPTGAWFFLEELAGLPCKEIALQSGKKGIVVSSNWNNSFHDAAAWPYMLVWAKGKRPFRWVTSRRKANYPATLRDVDSHRMYLRSLVRSGD